MGFAPFGIGLLMGLLTLTAYACCAAGDTRDWELQIETTTEYGPSTPCRYISARGLACGEIIYAFGRNKTLPAASRQAFGCP